MADLIFGTIASFDGYVADADGNFDWAAPSEEVHAHVNDLTRPVGTFLYGRRMYETLAVWETLDAGPDVPDAIRDFAGIWRAADKVVHSTTLDGVTTPRTRLERTFDLDAVRALKEAADHPLTVGGPGLAAHAIRAGLVDEYQLWVVPALVGGGTRALTDGIRYDLDLVDEHRFADGTVFLRYRTRR